MEVEVKVEAEAEAEVGACGCGWFERRCVGRTEVVGGYPSDGTHVYVASPSWVMNVHGFDG